MQRLARAPRTKAPPRTHSLNASSSRTYAVSVKPPFVYEHKPVPRLYDEHKTYLYNTYTRLLQTSITCPMVFLQHDKISIDHSIALRLAISKAAARHAPTLAELKPSKSKSKGKSAMAGAAKTHQGVVLPTEPKLTVVRTSLFGVALRDFAIYDRPAIEAVASSTKGGALAVLTLPSLNPPALNAILHAIARAIPPKTPAQIEEARKAAAQPAKKVYTPPTPGRYVPQQRTKSKPELAIVGALIDGRFFAPEGVQDVSNLPTLEQLRQQIVGLISSPSMQLAAILSEASGGKLSRTLDGFRQSLEEPAPPSEDTPSA